MYRLNISVFFIMFVIGLAVGPMTQWSHYHDFADQQVWLGSVNGKDVWSNLGFVIVGLIGMAGLYRLQSKHTAAWLTMTMMVLTGIGSGFYHLNPNDWTLVWDRLPISLICAGLIACTWSHTQKSPSVFCLMWGIFIAIFGVFWWHYSTDLRWYLGLQVWAMVLLPTWLKLAQASVSIQRCLWWAVGFYALSKVTESMDVIIWQASSQLISGHTLKHILATAAMWMMVQAIWLMQSINANGDHFANRKFGSLVCSDRCARQ